MRLLDLFCGAGGAAAGYHAAGFTVLGVDNRPQPRYPFDFLQTDAIEFLKGLSGPGPLPFDAIHASPPCQRWSARTPDRSRHPNLVSPTLLMLREIGLPWVVENVERCPVMGDSVILCGSSFGLPVRRHRRFAASFPLMAPPCAHGGQAKRFRIYNHGRWTLSANLYVHGTGGGKGMAQWAAGMGIDWMQWDELPDAIPPLYTELVGHQLRAAIDSAA